MDRWPLRVCLAAAVGCTQGNLPSPDGGTDAGGPLDSGAVDGGANSDGGSSDGGGTVDAGAFRPGPVGLYVPTFMQAIAPTNLYGRALTLPYVDGFFVSEQWKTAEVAPGVYDWRVLDANLRQVAQAGKKASVGVGAGTNSPAYVCAGTLPDGGPGPQCLNMTVFRGSGSGGPPTCDQITLPVPWDPRFQGPFQNMVDALGAFLADAGYLASGVISDVKITGINWDNEETILPTGDGGVKACDAGNACPTGQCFESDVIGMLTDAGYSEPTLAQTFVGLAGIFRSALPGVPIGAQVSPALPRPAGFAGSISTAVDQALVGSQGSLSPITAQDNGLSAVSPPDPGVTDAWDAGNAVGYQALYYIDGAKRCVMAGPGADAGPCDEAVACKTVDNAIDNGHAQWLELYVEDAVGYPDAGTYAHNRLLNGSPRGLCS